MIRLIVCDAGHTLGTFESPGTDDVLTPLTRFSQQRVHEESRRFLHECPDVPEAIEAALKRLCGALLIDPAALPNPWPTGRFAAYPYAREVLRMLRQTTDAPVVVLSNIPVTTGPGRMRDLREQLHPYIGITYTSYTMGARKPDALLWRAIAEDHDITNLNEIVHIGDQWNNDVEGAFYAGCRPIHVATRYAAPPKTDWPADDDCIGAADDLRGTIEIVRRWHERTDFSGRN